MRTGLFTAGIICGTLALGGQEKDTTFTTDVKVVNVFATVRDKQGKIVSSLNKEDFTLTENDAEQPIRYFSREVDLPLTIGLLVDTSMSQRRVLPQERTASYEFLDKVLKPDRDKAFLIHFDFETELLQDLTSSRADLQRALNLLELPAGRGGQQQRAGGGGGYPGQGSGQRGSGVPGMGGGIGFPGGGVGFPGGGHRGGGGYPRQGGGQQGRGGGGHSAMGTTLYDAVLLASDEITRKQPGRRALVLLTDGVDAGSRKSLNDAIEAAQRADTLVYSILFTDEQAYQGRGGGNTNQEGRHVLQKLSQQTGGTFYEVSKKLTIDQIYTQLQEELRNQYSLGYNAVAGDNSFRTIKVIGPRTMTVQAREGYYPSAR